MGRYDDDGIASRVGRSDDDGIASQVGRYDDEGIASRGWVGEHKEIDSMGLAMEGTGPSVNVTADSSSSCIIIC